MYSYKDSNHQVIGPVTEDVVRRLIQEGTLTRNSLLSGAGSDFWQPVYRFDEFSDVFDKPDVENLDLGPDEQRTASDGAEGDASIEAETTVEPEEETKHENEEDNERTFVNDGNKETSSDPDPTSDTPVRYLLIGGDGREYGPVTAGQLQAWIHQRRADGDSRVRRHDSDEWTTLGEIPEFQSAFERESKHQKSSPPPLDSVRANQIADEIVENGYDLNISECFRRSWKLYTQNFGILTGATALVIIILSFLNSIAGAGNVAGFALGGVFVAGLSWGYLKAIRGAAPTIQDTFDGFSRCFVPLLLASILTSVFVFAGLLLCILPGVYLFVAWLFVFPLIFELRLDFWPAMELSRKVVHERWWELFGLAFAVAILTFVGLLLFGIGVFFTSPVAVGAIMYAYDDIFRKYSAQAAAPPSMEAENQAVSTDTETK